MQRTGVAFAVAALVLAGCSDSRSNDAAAVVGSASVSRAQFESLMRSVAANTELFPAFAESAQTGTIEADAGRQLLSALVVDTATSAFLAEQGESITDADRQAALEALGPQAETLPADARDLIVDGQASAAALGRLAAGEGQAAYEASPAEVGVMCVRHILVETEVEAQEVLAELDEGADFAELATERSTEPAAATTGGAIELQPGQPCIPLEQAQGGLDPAFVAGAVEAVPGAPTDPVETSFGWHVILARPYEEVAAAVDPILGQRRFEEHLADVDVDVDPRYGRWDADTSAIVALEER